MGKNDVLCEYLYQNDYISAVIILKMKTIDIGLQNCKIFAKTLQMCKNFLPNLSLERKITIKSKGQDPNLKQIKDYLQTTTH